MQSRFSDCNGIKLEINNTNIIGKSRNIWELNDTLPKNPWVDKSKKKLESTLD